MAHGLRLRVTEARQSQHFDRKGRYREGGADGTGNRAVVFGPAHCADVDCSSTSQAECIQRLVAGSLIGLRLASL